MRIACCYLGGSSCHGDDKGFIEWVSASEFAILAHTHDLGDVRGKSVGTIPEVVQTASFAVMGFSSAFSASCVDVGGCMAGTS